MTSMMPEHTKGVFDGYSAYWRKAPEGVEKQNMMQIFEAWGADRARIEALWGKCRIIYYPPATEATGWVQPYPIEHNMAAGKNGREAIEAALAAKEET